MEMRIEIFPTYTIAYIRHTGPYGPTNAQTMDALKIWAESNRLLDDRSIILGIAQDDPAITAPKTAATMHAWYLGRIRLMVMNLSTWDPS